MSKQETFGELTDEQLEGVSGGLIITQLPKANSPKQQVFSSIGAGEISENSTLLAERD